MRALLAITLLLASCGDAAETASDILAPSAQAVTDTTPRVVSTEPTEVSLTIYPDDLALVTEVRTVDLPKGRVIVQFDGVTDLIIPQTLVLREFTGASLERNFDYDLLGREALYTESVGETVRLTRIDPGSGRVIVDEAVIVSADKNNGVFVETEDGLEGLFCSGLKTRTQFQGLPPGLAARPAMNVEVETEAAGEQTIMISYLTTGMDWAADYRLDLDGERNLLGWLTVENGTSKRFEDIDLSVIAGQLNRLPTTYQTIMTPAKINNNRHACWPVGSTKNPYAGRVIPSVSKMQTRRVQAFAPEAAMMMDMAEDEIVVTGSRIAKAVQEEVGDYKLYRIPRTLTVGAMQTKQLAFLDEPGVGVETRFVLDLDDVEEEIPMPLTIRYDIDNSREDGLAQPLPKGIVRVFARSEAGRSVYLGEDRIEDLPVDIDAKVEVGQSTTVFVRSENLTRRGERARARLTITNAGESAAMVELLDTSSAKTRITGADRVKDEDTPTWRVEVPANDSVEVTVRR